MATTNHQQNLTIFQMVINRLPFVINDDAHNFTVAIASRTGKNITLSGDWTPYLRANVTMSFTSPTATAEVQSFSYNETTNITTITFIVLVPGVIAGTILVIDANYNEQLISTFIYEAMVQMQGCFLIEPEANIGDEQYYTDLQKIILADLVAYRILFATTVGNAQGSQINTSGAVPTLRYVKSASTDGISTSWDYLNIKATAFLSMDAKDMMDKFANAACSNAKQLGCNIEVCNGGVTCSCNVPIIESPFLVAGPLPPCSDCLPPFRY